MSRITTENLPTHWEYSSGWLTKPYASTINRPYISSSKSNIINNPFWKDRIDNGEFVASPYSANYRFINIFKVLEYSFQEFSKPYRVANNFGGSFDYGGTSFSHPTLPSDMVSKAYALSTTSVLQRLSEDKPSIDGLPYYTERKKTAVLHREVTSSLITLITETVKILITRGGSTSNWKHLSKSIADLWLAWKFAIEPTLKDLEAAARRVAMEQYPMNLHSVNGSASTFDFKVPTTISEESLNVYSFTGLSCKKEVTCHTEFSTRVKAFRNLSIIRNGAAASCYSACSALLDFLNGISIKGALSNAWEIIPFSWAIDYFFHVSNFWEYDEEILMGVKGAVRTTKITSNFNINISVSQTPTSRKNWVLTPQSNGSTGVTYVSYIRELVDLSTAPDFLALPGFGIDAGYTQLSYLISVLVQSRFH